MSDYDTDIKKNRLRFGNVKFDKLIKPLFYSMIKNTEKEFFVWIAL